jgi:hypothetical protein
MLAIILFVVVVLAVAGVSAAEPFKYGLYSDEACVVPLPAFDPNPFPLETEDCQPYLRDFGPASSLKVLSCSSSCICFEESSSSDACDNVQSVKEVCMNKCRLDDTGNTFLRLFDFTGCGDKQVPDDEYTCPCTGMSKNCICAGVECEDETSGGVVAAGAQQATMALSLVTVVSFLLLA